MQLKLIKLMVWGIGACICILLLVTSYLSFFRSNSFAQQSIIFNVRKLPTSSFAFAKSEYASIGSPIFSLIAVAPRMQLPDFRNHLMYYGNNGRPDASYHQPKAHFGWQGSKTTISIASDEKVYLTFDKKLPSTCKYSFSPNNQETLVWFTAKMAANEAQIVVTMQDEMGEIVKEFSLQEKEPLRTNQGTWEIGKWRVDGTLLARQKARWMGIDRFLEKHGGDEYSELSGKHRIDFSDGEESYSIFVKAGDYVIWEDGHWKEAFQKTDTSDKPLLFIKKIEDRVMMCELWDIEGKGRLSLNLIRTPEPFAAQNVTNDFRFLGARTKTQVVFQVNRSRMLVKPNDWFVLTSEGWHKISSSEEVDDYVNRKIVGPLFVFEEIAKKDDGMVMMGTLFNPSRTEMHPIEVAMLPNGSTVEVLSPQEQEIIRPCAPTPFATH